MVELVEIDSWSCVWISLRSFVFILRAKVRRHFCRYDWNSTRTCGKSIVHWAAEVVHNGRLTKVLTVAKLH